MIKTSFEMIKSLEHENLRNHDAIKILNSPIFKIVLKLDELLPNLILLLNSKNRGPWKISMSNMNSKFFFKCCHE